MAKKFTTEIFIERARKVHGDRYDYSKVEYVDAKTKVCIICPEHGPFYILPQIHLTGKGCWDCVDLKEWTYDTCYSEAKKYQTKNQFRIGCYSAYRKARKEGWFEDYTWIVNGYALEGKKRRKWNYESCFEEAKKYKSRTEFQYGKGSSCAYKLARKEGWLKDYTWFSPSPKENGYWTKEQCYKEAKKYNYMVEFRHESASAYTIARREKWLDDYDWLIKKHKHWTYQECFEIAQKYSTKTDYKNASPSAYAASLDNEWLGDYIWFHEKPRPKYWTQERCYEEASKYKTKKEFASNSSAYSIACKNGWIVDYTWLNDSRIDIIKDKIDCVYSYYFKETHTIYIGRTINKKDRDYQHIFQTDKDSVARYAHKIGCSVPPMIILEDNLTIKQGQAQEEFWVKYYEEHGYNVLNKGAVGIGRSSLGTIGYGKWTRDACFSEAKKYKKKSEFKKNCEGAYSVALNKGWLKDYIWFDNSYHIYSEEECLKIAKTCEYKKDLITKYPGIYGAAQRRGWLKKYTWLKNASSHPNIKWTYNTCFEAAKNCNSKTEFETKYPAAMNLARKNGWLSEYTWFKRPPAQNVKWTYEMCKQEANKYKQKNEFIKHSKAAYLKAWKEGWLIDFFPKKEK